MSTEATPENLRAEADWLESERARDAEVDFGLLRGAADRIEALERIIGHEWLKYDLTELVYALPEPDAAILREILEANR